MSVTPQDYLEWADQQQVICGLSPVDLAARAVSADITGTWELTIHYEPDDRDYLATYVLRQEGEKVPGTYQGL